METNWVVQNSPFVAFPNQLACAILDKVPAADVAFALDVGRRDYFLLWKLSGKET
jgi:hypothetical protein